MRVLALNLERTLIDNALSGQPRPGLRDFLTFRDGRFARVAVFSTVEEADARDILEALARCGHIALSLMARLEFVACRGEFNDLAFVPNAMPREVVLVDDDAGWIRLDQRDQWIAIAPWDGGPDAELARVRTILES